MTDATDAQLTALAAKLADPDTCSCGFAYAEHCQECFMCPDGPPFHEDMCGW